MDEADGGVDQLKHSVAEALPHSAFYFDNIFLFLRPTFFNIFHGITMLSTSTSTFNAVDQQFPRPISEDYRE